MVVSDGTDDVIDDQGVDLVEHDIQDEDLQDQGLTALLYRCFIVVAGGILFYCRSFFLFSFFLFFLSPQDLRDRSTDREPF